MTSLFHIVSAAGQVVQDLQLQRRTGHRFLVPAMQVWESRSMGSFDPSAARRILRYYNPILAAFLCGPVARLQGHVLCDEERRRIALFAVLNTVGDELTDKTSLRFEALEGIALKPEKVKGGLFQERVAAQVQQALLHSVPDPARYLQLSGQMLHAQWRSKRQQSPDITYAELHALAKEKGGTSTLLTCACLHMPAWDLLEPALRRVGYLFQLSNDLFDIHKDLTEGLRTTANTCPDFSAFKSHLLGEMSGLSREVMALPFPDLRKRRFLAAIQAVNARSLVALHQFMAFETRVGNPIDWTKHPRKDRIVDMEEWGNRIRWMRYAFM
jgi:hypothetical protein